MDQGKTGLKKKKRGGSLAVCQSESHGPHSSRGMVAGGRCGKEPMVTASPSCMDPIHRGNGGRGGDKAG